MLFGGIPQGLPAFSVPNFDFDKILTLIGPAFTIAMLGAIESLLSAVVADGMSGTKHESNTELFGQGLANIFAPLFGGIASTGAIARTATNIRQGGNSPMSRYCSLATYIRGYFIIFSSLCCLHSISIYGSNIVCSIL